MGLGRLEEDVCPVDIGLGEVERVAEAVVHVGLGGKVHDGVDALFGHDVGDEVGGGDVAFNEFEVFEAVDFVEVGEAGAVIEFVVDDYVVVGVLFGEEDGYVRANEACW